jgi:5-methylcytosine-specific restriction endonuclease McrA
MVYTRPDRRYPRNWNKLRWAIFKEYSYICQDCKKYKKGHLQLHHIKPLWDGGTNHKENLTPLCKKCHKKADKLYILKKRGKK